MAELLNQVFLVQIFFGLLWDHFRFLFKFFYLFSFTLDEIYDFFIRSYVMVKK